MCGRALTKTDKTPYCGQNPPGFNKRNDVWSYESKLSPPIRHSFYWCSKLHFAHNRAINIKNIGAQLDAILFFHTFKPIIVFS